MNDLTQASRSPAYGRLVERFERMAVVDEAGAMLGWDQAAMMPEGGAAARGDQLATLAGIAHGMLIAHEVAADLAAAEADPPTDEIERRNLALMRRAHRRATAVPAELVEAVAREGAACEAAWRTARRDSDFAAVRPVFAQLVGLIREQAAALSDGLGLSPYDALIDQYQPGISAAGIEPVFARYEAFLRENLPRAERLQTRRPAALPGSAPFAEATQEALCRRLAAAVGLDFNAARLDRSLHPFCGGTPGDIRITTRYDETDFASAVMGVLHETGHALYESGLPRAWARQPVGMPAGMAVHESQSLIVELQAARSDAYLAWLGPQLAVAFGQAEADFAPPRLQARLRRVARSFIRVEADEMTYPAHVILRFRLEAAMIEGRLAAADLPEAWNEGLRDLLGIVPPDDARGCLQDIHWYTGLFGYFPSYTLGAMAAAQLMRAARRDRPEIDEALGTGDFAPLRAWLRANVHGHGARYGFNDLLVVASGKPLDPSDFEAHLHARYLG